VDGLGNPLRDPGKSLVDVPPARGVAGFELPGESLLDFPKT
jgi:hypothetical protein